MTTIYIKQDTVLPERHENDEYLTEKNLIQTFAEKFLGRYYDNILDIGAGDGRWGEICASVIMPEEMYVVPELTGVEIQDKPKPCSFDFWFNNQDYTTWVAPEQYDLIVSNPPYNLAEKIIRKAWSELRPGGDMFFLLRLAFAEGVDRYEHLWQELPLFKLYVMSRRPRFYGTGTNGTSFGIFHWSKDDDGKPVGTPGSWVTTLMLHERDKVVRKPANQNKLEEFFANNEGIESAPVASMFSSYDTWHDGDRINPNLTDEE